jgi:hypothetical protein
MNPTRTLLFPLILYFAACIDGGNGSATIGSSEGTDAGNGLDPDGSSTSADGGTTSVSDYPPVEAGSPYPLDAQAIPPLSLDAEVLVDGASPAPADAGASTADASCTTPLAGGTLLIDELMVDSVAGSGDYGQWFEVRSTATCEVDLRGLQGASAAGSKVYTFDVAYDLWLDPGGFFIVADSADPIVNHDLPGTVITWTGQPGDVLRKEGATITLSVGDVLVDTLTYPSVKWTIGASLEFPAGCPVSARSDFSNWQTSMASWFPGFLGTPNAANTDVSCP